jgi:hypothetical protein
MKPVGEKQVNINVPWSKLHPQWKKENIAAGKAAVKAVNYVLKK